MKEPTMDEQQLRASIEDAITWPGLSAGAFGTIRDSIIELHQGLARIDDEIAALKAEIHELQRNAAGGGITG